MFGSNPNQSVVGKGSTTVNCSAEEVFNFIGVEFFKNYPRWSPEVRELEPLSDKRLEQGSLVRQVRVDQGQRSESTFRVTRYEPARHICFQGVSNPYRCTYEIDSMGNVNCCQLRFTFELLRLELFMLPFEKMVRLVVQDGAERTVRNIKRLVEAESASMAKNVASGLGQKPNIAGAL